MLEDNTKLGVMHEIGHEAFQRAMQRLWSGTD